MSYYDDARRRARRRKSPWNLLLIPGFVLPAALLLWTFVGSLAWLHEKMYSGQTLPRAKGLGPILAAVASLLASIPLSFLVGNTLVWLVPPARRALDSEARSVPRVGFWRAQRDLWRVARYLVPAALGLGLLGALLPWSS
jgi:hypothetical protein